MYGTIDTRLLLEYGRSRGVFYQLDLDLEPLSYTIDKDLICDVKVGWKCLNNGKDSGTLAYVDHPCFTAFRDHLEATGHIKTERKWHNGDVVLKSFFLNDVLFECGDTFLCGSAMRHHINK